MRKALDRPRQADAGPPAPPAGSSPRRRAPRRVSSFWSRILVSVVGLPIVLGLIWLGGWWLAALAAAAAVIALHELYTVARSHRPVVIAGYAASLCAILGAKLGGGMWMVGGFLVCLPVAFLLKGFAGTRRSMTVSVGVTVLGAAWIGLGAAHLVLLRDLTDRGRLATITVILAVFAADTAAYFGGRLVGRHKLAPLTSPGKTWEGLAFGTLAALAVPFFALYHQGFLDVASSLVLGAVIAVAAPLGDLFESSIKRDLDVKDTGRLLAGHGGMLDRIDALLFAAPACVYVIAALT
jgi:phosphatidate cytidylyltransferase